MKYYSLKNYPVGVNFEQALIQSIAPDKSLYFPEKITPLNKNIIENFYDLSIEEIAFEAISQFVGTCIPKDELQNIVVETLCFDFPLVSLTDNIYSLELYHGPTLAFKDVGARFMARCLAYFAKNNPQRRTVLVATSGDTGGAVAAGFYEAPHIDVVILYPKNKISALQERQLCTLGKNITALAVEGDFDDCQAMVKNAFLDKELNEKRGLVSANSINVARWLPQMFYYINACQKLKHKKIVFSVPSGNFGNICAGIVAQQLGFPIAHFIVANNENNVVDRYLKTRKYDIKKTIPTLSNAMDVSAPSNFVRIEKIYGTFDTLVQHISSYSYTDAQVSQTLQSVYENFSYLLDPHGAIGYQALKEFLIQKPDYTGVFLETAHPAKFKENVEKIIGKSIIIPETLRQLEDKSFDLKPIANDFTALKKYLLS